MILGGRSEYETVLEVGGAVSVDNAVFEVDGAGSVDNTVFEVGGAQRCVRS